MTTGLYKKGLVLGIICLFIGASISTLTYAKNKSIKQPIEDYIEKPFTIKDVKERINRIL